MIGYHYTTYANWLKIKKQGLIPYMIEHDEILDTLKKPIWGVFLWQRRQRGISHLGCLLDRMIKKKSPKLVLLKARYNKNDILEQIGDDTISLDHTGELGEWVYHKSEPVVIVKVKIPVKNIELIRIYNFLEFTT